MYRILDMGPVANSVADILSVLYMLFGISVCIRKILSAFCGYQLSRFNLKDGEVELKEASIFNKHLDEIIYFFQRTKYDVVIIEDLDRFNTSDIYLKLRELNQLINESKEIGRHIVFIYAVKDDVFKDEQRAKFFDYITTVIPIINPSNSKDKLKEALRLRGYEDIADDDLQRYDGDLLHGSLPVGQLFHIVGGYALGLQPAHEIVGHAVIDGALAGDGALLQAVKRSGVVLVGDDDHIGVLGGIDLLGLALVQLLQFVHNEILPS